MPEGIEREIRKSASSKGMTGDRADHYVYGTMQNLGFMRGRATTDKGQAAERRLKAHRIKKAREK